MKMSFAALMGLPEVPKAPKRQPLQRIHSISNLLFLNKAM